MRYFNYELMIHSEALAQFMLQHICHFGSKKPVLMGKNNPLTEITQEMGLMEDTSIN